MLSKRLKPQPLWRITLILACYFALALNLPIYAKLHQIFTELESVKIGFIISIPLFFILAMNFIFSLLNWPYVGKAFFSILIVISSVISYAGYNYGTIVDQDMLVNILETNSHEAGSYFSLTALFWVLGLGVLPAVILLLTPVRPAPSIFRLLLSKVISMVVSLLLVVVIAGFYYQDYASVGRNQPYLKKMIIPTHFVYSAVKLIDKRYLSTPLTYKTIGEDAKQNPAYFHDKGNGKPTLLIFLLGETARAQNYQYNGYERDTNAFTQKYNPVVFNHVSSCGTATAVSVPCMFSILQHSNFDRERADMQDNALDILKRAGVSVLWKDNDGGDKHVAHNVAKLDEHQLAKLDVSSHPLCNGETCYDEIMLADLDSQIAQMKGNRVMVMHLIGSHGPTYFQRYPKAMAHYQPDCARADIENCSNEQIRNAYDNTIRYTDYVMANLIEKLISLEDRYNTALIYISDHGESIGEHGVYLHGTPYAIAPEQQTKVPLLMWMSPGFAQSKQIDLNCLRKMGKENEYSQDNIFHSLLGAMDIQTKVYEAQLDLFSNCRPSK
ncbi:Phosphoethanolamine transferase EptA [Vibrio stylophorae]|uniref:Phosphoethanolamine transferase EptA n=1 Tax=Vibrio stylophorae TaxID=659351 RepID=A0ABN8DRH4_9VIBR|nr:phosphoethanolamine--lipid A transferase [Vibrio stylophorae]CAH0533252.1 Phosphoethanolamine transferase EptA [Vibrio stylophorae]